MLAKSVCHSTDSWLIYRFREQARSHNGFAVCLKNYNGSV